MITSGVICLLFLLLGGASPRSLATPKFICIEIPQNQTHESAAPKNTSLQSRRENPTLHPLNEAPRRSLKSEATIASRDAFKAVDLNTRNAELIFQQSVVTLCQNAYPDVTSLSAHGTPYQATNCSILCVYGRPEIPIPDGGMCYLKLNFIGTPGHCLDGVCKTTGSPFSFSFDVSQVRPMPETPGFVPDVHTGIKE